MESKKRIAISRRKFVGSIGTAAAAFTNIKQAATTVDTGVVALATSAEVSAGTDANKVITEESSKILNTFGQVLQILPNINHNKIGVFYKLAHNGSMNVYFSPESAKLLANDLTQFNPEICNQPNLFTDEDGSDLHLAFGNPELAGLVL